ncbi:MAG: type VI secretion system baseplate subunit TssE [Pseudomonadota bacterium]
MPDKRVHTDPGTLAFSLLDRLLDDAPDLERDPPETRGQQVARIREGLRRDLETLLNTRCRPTSPPKALEALGGSLLRFGAPGFFGASLVTYAQRTGLAQDLERRIQAFEPRLEGLSVTILDTPGTLHRALRLRIRATYTLQEGLPELNFETRLDPVTQRFSVREAARE